MTALVRKDLRDALKAASKAHPGLLLQRGWTDHVKTDAANEGSGGKGEHLKRICAIPVEDFYQHAYDRWMKGTADTDRFARIAMKIEGRLLIGLASGAALETGCAVSHTYGTPYLPGSSIKGVVRVWAETNLSDNQTYLDQLFGTQDLSGLISFHDAWWVPGRGEGAHKDKPFVQDIVTPHHPEYYKDAGTSPATDLDSPVPNGLIGVRGSFLFVIEGNPQWLNLARKSLETALGENGIGAKTRAGYGYLSKDEAESTRMEVEAANEKRMALPIQERLAMEAEVLTEKQIAEKFGSDVNKTKEQYQENFDTFVQLVIEKHGATIEGWKTETKKTNKPRWKAYRLFNGSGEAD